VPPVATASESTRPETEPRASAVDAHGVTRFRHSTPAHLLHIAATAVFVGVIVFTLWTALRIQTSAHTTIPFADLWAAVDVAQDAANGTLELGELLSQHNEHRIALARIQFVVEYALFDGQLIFLLGMIMVSCVGIALVLTWPFADVWRSRFVTVGFFAFALSAVLTPAGWENLTWPFQVGFVQVYCSRRCLSRLRRSHCARACP
jgi:hypothetical protein